MTKPHRLATRFAAVSLIALATACSGPVIGGHRSATVDNKAAKTAGFATRALMALEANDIAGATTLAEQAVEASPNDASFRALLGNCYLASGRYQSAEAAYKDSLTLVGNQPKVVLKLALIQTALGRTAEANDLLVQAQQIIDPTDLGLALALAGNSGGAITVLEQAARQIGAEARTRQNLAFAYAMAERWQDARVVASQDLPGNLVDGRIQQWMSLAKPGRASDQVASFIGISPVAGDPGQPVRLALNKSVEDVRYAAAEPLPTPAVTEGLTETAVVDVPVAALAPVDAAPLPVQTAYVADPIAPTPEPQAAPDQAPSFAIAEATPVAPPAPALSPAAVRVTETVASLRRAAARANAQGNSKVVVQLGAYSSQASIKDAWKKVSSNYASLKGYTPVTARYAGPKGMVYRLSVKGFTSDRDARSLCSKLQASGRACFVRTSAGDAPVRFAAR